MALNDNLIASWNFDTVTGSNSTGSFLVNDISNEYTGKGVSFDANSQEFILKEDIKTGKKLHFETLEGLDTIQLVDVDDATISPLQKPSSVKLMVENSMYQLISDEMMNLFTTVDAYAFKFSLPDNKYKYEYDKLIELREYFYEKVLEKPSLEKYIEFYKWIDASLGALLDQLKPENSSDFKGLKSTIESHILERNKYQHVLPVSLQPDRVYTNESVSPITVIKSVSGSAIINGGSTSTNKRPFLQGDVSGSIVSITNEQDKNYTENYQIIQTAGRYANNRQDKTNKTVLQTRFSAGDGLSELNRDNSLEYSVYSDLNQRAKTIRNLLNAASSKSTDIQGTSSVAEYTVDDNTIALIHWDDTAGAYAQANDYGKIGFENPTGYYRAGLAGGASANSAIKKFGAYSLSKTFDRPYFWEGPDISSYLTNINGTSGDFTIEGWYYVQGAGANYPLFQIGNLVFATEGNPTFFVKFGDSTGVDYFGANIKITTPLFSRNTWYHFAMTRSGNLVRVFANGQKIYEDVPGLSFTANSIVIGSVADIYRLLNQYEGIVDEFRISDICRYTDNFTPPTQAFADYRLNGSYRVKTFADNSFIQRNVPYNDENFASAELLSYKPIPDAEREFRQRNNLLIDDPTTEYTLIEPPIEFNPPAKHNIRVKDAFEDIEIYSPYDNLIDTFSPRTLQETGTIKKGFRAYFDRPIDNLDASQTFFNEAFALNDTGSIKINSYELLHNVYPRKDLVGLAEVRTKPNYEETEGYFNTSSLTWSQNSYNNNTADIRSFWRDNIEDRKRTRGFDSPYGTGSINCLDSYSVKEERKKTIVDFNIGYQIYSSSVTQSYITLTTNLYWNNFDSISSLDGKTDYSILDNYTELLLYFGANGYYFFGFKETTPNTILGDLAPLPHQEAVKFIMPQTATLVTVPNRGYVGGGAKKKAKPQFIFNNYPSYLNEYSSSYYDGGGQGTGSVTFYFNKSYLSKSNDIVPFYDSYKDFFEDIKHLSQNRAIIPEYNISSHEKSLQNNFNYDKDDYLKILGREQSKELTKIKDFFISDLNKFVNKKSNKLKFSLSGIKKLLPYNGFYPQQFSLEVIKNFYNSYLSSSKLAEDEKMAIIQPFFSPGILFNTIKSGIAVDYPVLKITPSSLITPNKLSYYDIYYPVILESLYSPYNRYPTADKGIGLVKTLNYRVPFEGLLDPYAYLFNDDNNSIAYLDPTHYSDIFTLQISQDFSVGNYKYYRDLNYPSCSLSKLSSSYRTVTDTPYKKSINNFLASTVDFFLKDSQLTYFSSEAENNFSNFESGSVYSMAVTIKKNDNFSMFYKSNSETDLFTEHMLFGPPVTPSTTSFNSSVHNPFQQANYYPFTPPYLRNTRDERYQNNIVLYFTASKNTHTLEEIFKSLKTKKGYIVGSNVGKNSMYLDSCLYLSQSVPDTSIDFDSITGNPIITTKKDSKKWVIQTKFETPLIDYNNTNTSPIIYTQKIQSQDKFSNPTGKDIAVSASMININGIWNTLGSIPKDEESVQLELQEIPNFLKDDYYGFDNTKSLLDIVKFKKEKKSIGILKENHEISEGIVLIPYLQKNNRQDSNLVENLIEDDKYFFKISPETINELLKADYTKLSIEKIKIILENNTNIDKNNSIVDLMIKMVNYNIPPHLNWLYDKNIKPFIMCIVEFKETLNKEDLSNIWQGNMPELAKKAKEETIEIEYSLDKKELFENFNFENNLNAKIKIFKIKKRAKNNYFDLTQNIEDNKKYSFDGNTEIPWYTYNWPYDYFSLVELVNIQAGEAYEVTGSV